MPVLLGTSDRLRSAYTLSLMSQSQESSPPLQQSPPYPTEVPGYSPQYGFWPYYLTPPDALLGPARRASLMLFLLGGLLLLATTCAGVSVVGETDEMLIKGIEDMRQVSPEAAAVYTPRLLRTVQGAMAVIIGLLGVTAIILAVVVRSGSRASSVTALVLVVLPTLGTILLLLLSLLGGPTTFATSLLILFIPLALSGMTIAFLINAIRAAGQVDAARRQMYAMHQHQQMQYQAYAQSFPQQPPQS